MSTPLQVMEEGERLSKKQLAQESTIKKLRAQVEEARTRNGEAGAAVAVERNRLDAERAARQKAEADLSTLRTSHRAELDAERTRHEAMLQQARAAQVRTEVHIHRARVRACELCCSKF